MAYVTTFIIAISSLYLSEGERRNHNNSSSAIFALIGIIVPCILAGARNTGIGTDTSGYGIWLYNLASEQHNLDEYMNLAMNGAFNMDLLFAFQAYLVVQATQSIFWYYFFIQLLIILPIYVAILKMIRSEMVCPCMAFYLIIFFIPGLNAMRQSIAMSFCFLAYSYLESRRYLRCLLLCLIAVLFHVSAIIGFTPLIIHTVFLKWNYDNNTFRFRRYSRVILPISMILGLSIILNLRSILSLTIKIMPQFSRYAYTLSYMGETHLGFYVVYGIILIALVYCARCEHKLADPATIILICIVLLSFPIQTLEIYSQALQRLSRYTLLYSVPLLSAVSNKAKHYSQINWAYSLIALCCLTAFLWFYAINGNNDAIPYSSSLLGL